MSRLGALKSYKKKVPIKKDPTLGYTAPVYNPFGLPLYKESPANNPKKAALQIRNDPTQS
jgi:hypothetical protein